MITFEFSKEQTKRNKKTISILNSDSILSPEAEVIFQKTWEDGVERTKRRIK